MPITRLLIANRGEIAIRVARTAADMGLETVAIYSPDDAHCLHVRSADSALELPGAGVAAYLEIPAIIDAAKRGGCDAVHPGYGLLSERGDFARACAAAGLIFVGPAADTLDLLGDKMQARQAARALSIPVIEGRDINDTDALADFLRDVGRPVMVKAAMGGGGRGMRVVSDATEAEAAFAQCSAEADSAFGDGRLYGEVFLPAVRHVEVQIIGDGTSVTHLWDRDCTLQRRNQKIVEIAPAPDLAPELRAALLRDAVALGQSTGYRGLGTAEFLVETDTGAYYFIETNPRIQVEHTVSEDWAGVDLVEIQLRLADGAALDHLGLPDVAGPMPTGFAVQARINTERLGPDGQITPTGGRIDTFVLPGGRGVRIDTHGYSGYRTNPGFDSMLAKLILRTASDDLGALLTRTRRALAEFHVSGVETNIPLLSALLARPELADWDVDTRLIERISAELTGAEAAPDGFFAPLAPDAAIPIQTAPDGQIAVTAQMQAVLVSFEIAEGEIAQPGQTLAIVEAMKMQHEIRAPEPCVVRAHLAAPGDPVERDQPILFAEPAETGQSAQDADARVDPDHIRADLQSLRDRTALTLDTNRPKAVERRRSRGQRTARENLDDLLQGGAFLEYGQLVFAAQRRRHPLDDLRAATPADGIITGVGTVNGALFPEGDTNVAILAYDGTVMAGTQGMMGHLKTDRLLELARDEKLPVIFYTEGGGGRPGDEDFADVMSTGLSIMTFNLMARLTATKPSIGVNSGYCFAGNAAVFGACDIKIATRDSWIGLGGPAMVEAGGLGAHSPKDIGPAPMQAQIGLLDLLAEDEADATAMARQVLACFQGPLSDWQAPDQRLLRHAIPENRKRVYDIRTVIAGLADTDTFLETRAAFAPGMITGFLRVEGHAFGLIANNPKHLGGALDAQASEKAAGFLRLCSRFGLPVLSLCDTPGFMVGPESEQQGGVQRACELITAGAQMQSPLFTIVLRKGYGIGAQAMAGGSFAAPFFNIAWPTGEFGAMGLEGAVTLGYKREMEAETDPVARQALFDRLVAKSYENGRALNVASLQEIDAVIDPADTRDWIMNGLRAATRGAAL